MKIVAGLIVKNEADSFWEKVDRSDPEGCWTWLRSKDQAGYGRVAIKRISKSPLRAHRVALALSGVTVPEAAVVRHTCDNPSCVNPRHLLLGTRADNAADMVERGRSTRGRKHPNFGRTGEQAFSGCRQTLGARKLTEREVCDIRRERDANGTSYRDLGERFGITGTNAWMICTRQTWRDVC